MPGLFVCFSGVMEGIGGNMRRGGAVRREGHLPRLAPVMRQVVVLGGIVGEVYGWTGQFPKGIERSIYRRGRDGCRHDVPRQNDRNTC